MSLEHPASGRSRQRSADRRHVGRARRSLVPVALVALLVLAGCAGTGQPVGPGAAATTGLSSPLANAGPLPTTVDGGRLDPATLAGKPVVLWFWAPWCAVCRGEGPTIAKVASEFTGKVRFIGVAGEGTLPAMTAFVKATGTGGLTHLADVSGSVWRDYGVSVQPAFAFITADGTVDLRIGSLDEATLRARVTELGGGIRTSTVTSTPGQYCSRAPDGRQICGASGPPHSATTTGPTRTP